MTAEEFATEWKDSPEHAELIAWLSWYLTNERAVDSIPCCVVPFWELSEAIDAAGLKPTSTIEILRAAGLIVPQSIRHARAPEQPETITPAHPHQLRPDGWLITGNVLFVRKRWTTARSGDVEFVTIEMLTKHADRSRTPFRNAFTNHPIATRPMGRAVGYLYSEVLPVLRRAIPDVQWPETASDLENQ